MASSIIPYPALESGTITKSTSTGTMSNALLKRINNIVFLRGAITGMSNQAENGTFFNVPEGYRPRTEAPISIMFHDISSGNYITYTATVKTTGNIDLLYSQSKTDEVTVWGTYPI